MAKKEMAEKEFEKTDEETNEIGDKSGDKLMAAALKAYGIAPRYVLASRYDPETGEMVIVTHGGSKVRYREGDHPQPLSSIAVTGINPEAAKRKVIAGAARE